MIVRGKPNSFSSWRMSLTTGSNEAALEWEKLRRKMRTPFRTMAFMVS